MDTRNSKITLVTYLLIAVLGFGGLFLYISEVQENFRVRMDEVSSSFESDEPHQRPPVLLERRDVPNEMATVSGEMEMISELRDLLDQRTQQLRQRNQELAETTDDYRKLGEENERYAAMLSEMTHQADAEADPVESDAESQARDEDFDLLEWALNESQETIGMLEAAQLQQRELANAIETSIVASGPSAIPVLLSVLTSDRADLRIWAATLLGRMGPLAFEASDPLRIVSMEDQDPDVRRTATWAVGQIDNSFE